MPNNTHEILTLDNLVAKIRHIETEIYNIECALDKSGVQTPFHRELSLLLATIKLAHEKSEYVAYLSKTYDEHLKFTNKCKKEEE